MDMDEFRMSGHKVVDWMADYLEGIERYPVLSQVRPGEIADQIPSEPPQGPETFEGIFQDFERIIMPGITHWQHPSFFAYFPANSSPPSVLAEMLVDTLAVQCMIWQTSPAATELEGRVMEWLRKMIGLPPEFVGVIEDTASTATLCSILTARERAFDYSINSAGMSDKGVLAAYCSEETHSSIEKDIKIAGFGRENLRKIPVDDGFSMIPEQLEAAIERDVSEGRRPICCVATIGTTGSTAIDPLKRIGEICSKHGVWLHVDAAMAGTALLLPEFRWMIDGIEHVDSFVFNPHKWLFSNLPCSAYFVKDPGALIRTLEIMPEYLKTTDKERTTNYRDWGIQLGRRFNALKLWFVIRNYGVEGIQGMVREHIRLAQDLAERIEQSSEFELLAPVPLNTICFRHRPSEVGDLDMLNKVNEALLHQVNSTGRLYITHTKLNGAFALRFVVGQTYTRHEHVERGWSLIQETARALKVP
jgi:aromatic-L-amino-acid decarboxylase